MVIDDAALADRLEWHEEMGNGENALRIGGEVRDLGGALVLYSRPEFGTGFNFACRLRSSEREIDRLLDRTVGWLAGHSVKPHVRVNGLSTPSDLVTRLAARGFVQTEAETQMLLCEHDVERPHNDKVRIREIEPRELETWLAIQNIGFGGNGHLPESSLELSRAIMAEGGRDYLAELDGAPVGAATLESFANIWGIYGVATLPGARGSGVGSALVRRMIRDARAEADWPICLQVETASKTQAWYERLGFRTVYDRTGWTLDR